MEVSGETHMTIVCKMRDGRALVVEYKGADRWSNDDSKEKRRLGDLLVFKNSCTCLFIMPKGKKIEEISLLVQKKLQSSHIR